MPDRDPPIPGVPDSRAVPGKHTRLSPVWIIPILAAALGVWVAVTRIMSEGPKITIVFQSAEGLEAGKTKISYRGVDVGTITAIRLSRDHQRVIATAQMTPKTEEFLAEDTRFWVVRPRISGASVTGLGTLISGAYIGMEIGSSKEPKRDFVALQTPPVVTGNAPGRFFVLKTSDLGSLDLGIAERDGERGVGANAANLAALNDVAIAGNAVELVVEHPVGGQVDIAVARLTGVAVIVRNEAVRGCDLKCRDDRQ